MSAMERSLRRALEAGNATDPAFRESIYSASERALERMLAEKPIDETTAHTQRTRLAETINRVEDEFYDRQTEAGSAGDGPAQHDAALSLDPAYTDAHGYATHSADETKDDADVDKRNGDLDLHPVFGRGEVDGEGDEGAAVAMEVSRRDERGRVERVSETVKPSARVQGREAGRKVGRRTGSQIRLLLLIAGVVLVLLGAGVYLVYAATAKSEALTSIGAGAANRIELFDGRGLEAIAAPNGGRVEAIGGMNGAAVRFAAASETAALDVAIGPGVVSLIDGRTVRVEIEIGSPDGTERSFGVRCLLDMRDVCGHRRFTMRRSNEVFAFEMHVPKGATAGTFKLDPAASGQREAIDLYSVRLVELTS